MNNKTIFEVTKRIINGIGKVASYAVILLVADASKEIILQEKNQPVSAGYGDAVREIMESDMFDSTKRSAIQSLRKNGDYDYYKAVISVINSDMFDSTKLGLIKDLSN